MTGTGGPRDSLGGIPRLYRENPMLLTLSILMFSNMLGFGMIVPVIPLYGRTFDVSTTMVGLLVTSFGVARLVSNLPAGRLADRIGRRKLLIAGPLISAVGASLAFLAPSFWMLMGALTIQGVGSAIYATAAMTTLADISTEENRGRMMSLNQGSLLLGSGFGPSIGGIIGGTLGLQAVFLAAIFMYLVVAMLAFVRVTETLSADGGSSARRGRGGRGSPTLALLFNFSFLTVAMVSMMIFFTRTGSRATIVPLRSAEDLFMSTTMIGGLLTVAAILNVLALPLAGWGIDKFGRKKMIVPSTIISGGGILTMALAPNVPVMFLGVAIYGLGSGVAGPAPAAYVADLARGRNYGATLGLFRSVSDAGFVLGPILLGFFADLRSYSFALGVNAALLIIAGLVFAVFATEVRGSGQAVEDPESDQGDPDRSDRPPTGNPSS